MIDVRALLESLGLAVTADDGEDVRARCPSGRHPDRDASWWIKCAGERTGLQRVFVPATSVRDAGSLVQHHCLGIGFGVARIWVEEHATVPDELATSVRVVVKAPRQPFRFPIGVTVEPLDLWPTPARRYAESRGITPYQVERWGIGHGLGGALDGRIIIPIRDASFRLASYVARAYAGQPARYLTPRDGDGADRSVLFGEEHERPGAPCVVVEGALNALAVERAWPQCSVLALGGSRGSSCRRRRGSASIPRSWSRPTGTPRGTRRRGSWSRRFVGIVRECGPAAAPRGTEDPANAEPARGLREVPRGRGTRRQVIASGRDCSSGGTEHDGQRWMYSDLAARPSGRGAGVGQGGRRGGSGVVTRAVRRGLGLRPRRNAFSKATTRPPADPSRAAGRSGRR